MEPVIVNCTGTCEVTHRISVSPFDMDLSAASQIAGAVLAVWAVGWAFRALIRMLKDSDGVSSTSDE